MLRQAENRVGEMLRQAENRVGEPGIDCQTPPLCSAVLPPRFRH